MPSISIHPVKLLCCLLLCSGAVQAKQSDYKEQIFVDASSQQAELAINKVTYFGPVTITQGTTKITVAADGTVTAIVNNNSAAPVQLGNIQLKTILEQIELKYIREYCSLYGTLEKTAEKLDMNLKTLSRRKKHLEEKYPRSENL